MQFSTMSNCCLDFLVVRLDSVVCPVIYEATSCMNDRPMYSQTIRVPQDRPAYSQTIGALQDHPAYSETIRALQDHPAYNNFDKKYSVIGIDFSFYAYFVLVMFFK